MPWHIFKCAVEMSRNKGQDSPSVLLYTFCSCHSPMLALFSASHGCSVHSCHVHRHGLCVWLVMTNKCHRKLCSLEKPWTDILGNVKRKTDSWSEGIFKLLWKQCRLRYKSRGNKILEHIFPLSHCLSSKKRTQRQKLLAKTMHALLLCPLCSQVLLADWTKRIAWTGITECPVSFWWNNNWLIDFESQAGVTGCRAKSWWGFVGSPMTQGVQCVPIAP